MVPLGYRIGQVRCVFGLPASATQSWFSSMTIPTHLAYIEWFTPFTTPGRHHELYKVSRHHINGIQQTSIVPVQLIRQSVHLIPDFGASAPPEWKSSSVLEQCSSFYVNSFSDRFQYSTIF